MPWKRLALPLLLVLPFCPLRPAAAQGSTAPATAPADNPDYWRDHHVGLLLHGIGYAYQRPGLHRRFFASGRPSGVPADDFGNTLWLLSGATYGFGDGLEAGVSATRVERPGPTDSQNFFGVGIQKQFITERQSRPAVSVGAFGFTGPDDADGGRFYLAASKQIFGDHTLDRPALFLHAGLELETFDTRLDASTGLRPYVGANLTLTPWLFLSADYAPEQSWETQSLWSARALVLPWKIPWKVLHGKLLVGAEVGILSTGYQTHSYVGPRVDFDLYR